MPPGIRGIAVAALAIVAVLAPASTAWGEVGYSTRSFSQSALFTVPDPAELRSQCLGKPVRGSETFAQALSKTDAFLKQSAPAAALRGIARSPILADQRQARMLASTALLDDKPVAALATLADVVKARPNDTQTLLTLSALLGQLGLSREALAVAARVKSLKAAPRMMGVVPRAGLLNNEGFAQMSLGRYGDAVRTLTAAVKASPTVGAAEQNLAIAKLCAGGGGGGGRPSQAIVEPPWPPPDPPLPPDDPPVTSGTGVGATETLPVDRSFDLSQGVPANLPDIKLPQTPDEAVAAIDEFRTIVEDAQAASNVMLTQAGDLRSKELAEKPSALTLRRTNDIDFMIEFPDLRIPQLAALRAKVDLGRDPVVNARAQWLDDFAQDADACTGAQDSGACLRQRCTPHLAARHAQWLGAMRSWENGWQTYFGLRNQIQTGLAANLADPLAHEAALLEIQAIRVDYLVDFYFLSEEWLAAVSSADQCWGQPQPAPPTAEPALGPKPAAPACPAPLNALKVGVQLTTGGKSPTNLAKISASCEKVEIEVSGKAGKSGIGKLLGPFGTLSVKPGKGEVTIVIGAKLGFDKGFLGSKLGAGWKTGVYITTQSGHGVTDIGWRTGPSGDFSVGDYKLSASDTMDFSFLDKPAGACQGCTPVVPRAAGPYL